MFYIVFYKGLPLKMFNLGTDFGTFPAGLKQCQAGIYLEGYGETKY